jgi:CubicO group peptidase (beta-lactamase class C family)
MALWAQAVMDGRLLKPEALTQAWSPARLKNGETTGYGLGWGVGCVAGHREVNHSGGHASGFSSFLGVYPEDRLAVVVLLNRGGVEANRIGRRVAGVYVPELTPPASKPIEGEEP